MLVSKSDGFKKITMRINMSWRSFGTKLEREITQAENNSIEMEEIIKETKIH